MSANLPGGFNPRDPFASKPGGVYDPGTLNALYLRAQRGDLNARKYLQGLGVLGNQGQDVFAPSDVQAGNYAPAIQQWATQTKSTPYSGQGFQWNQNWTAGDPTFQKAWGDWFSGAGGSYDQQQAGGKTVTNQGASTQTPTPAAATNPFGYDYSKVAPGYNAWALYNGGTQDGGWYNAGTDTLKWDDGRGNGGTQNSRDRVWRLTLDDLKNTQEYQNAGGDFSKIPVDVVNRTFLNEVARLHRDINNTPGMGPQAWAQSGFAGMDRAVTTSQPAPGAPAPGAPAPGAPAPGAPAPTTYTDPVTGQTKTYTGNLDPTQLAKNIALHDPQNQDARLSYIMRQYGIDPTRGGLYTSSIARALAPQIEASNQLNGLFGDTNAIDTAQSNLDSLGRSLAGPGGFAAQQARARGILADPRLGTLTGGLTDPQTIDTLQTILSEAYAGANPIYNQSRLGYFNQALGPGGAYGQYSLDHPQTGAPGYQHPLQWLASTPWASLLQGY